ncbi:MAG: preprotein translocase subunit YajC [Pseudomonadota bacterium]|nr:preprotein translocase subunit YajC [Pseudomonadota bacterium]
MSTPEGLLVSLQAAPGGGFTSSLLLMVAFVAIFYFVMLRPQQQEAKEQAKLLASLQKGDRVVTAAGIHAKVHEVKADTLILEVAPNVTITVDRESVRKKVVDGAKADAPTKGA